MARVLKKFSVFALFICGIFFYALIKNLTVPGSRAGYSYAENPMIGRREIISHLNNLEKEITEQKEISNNLLEKMRSKYSKSEIPQKTKNSKEVLGKSDKQVESSKLLALQKELQLQEINVGEVRSEEIENKKHKKDKDEDFANGEVMDDHTPSSLNQNKSLYIYNDEDSVIAVLVFVCDRPTVTRSLDKLFEYRPSAKKFPIIVSQDCGSHAATTSAIQSYGNRLTHIMQPDLSEIQVPPKEKKFIGYYKIARHYGWALNETFNKLRYDNVIIVEDDIEIAPDFFEYFAATLPILKKDPTIWCISAWSDNGKPNRINETAYDLLYRSDFFPGLGWMMTKSLWKEIGAKWPKGYWDDWMREPAQRKNRVCIRPEISRTSTFGKKGVSMGEYYMNHLRFIKLNNHFVPFKSLDLTYLLKDNYDVDFVRRVYSSDVVHSVSELITKTSENLKPKPVEYRLVYRTQKDFRDYAKKLELMQDFKAGVPRTAYRGVVSFFMNGHRCYLAPGANWESYQPF